MVGHLLHQSQGMGLHHQEVHLLHQRPQVVVLGQEFRVGGECHEQWATSRGADGSTSCLHCLQDLGPVERLVSIVDLQSLDVLRF